MDPALRREGRFRVNLFIPPPDKEAREEILQLHLANRPTAEIDYEELSALTEGFSWADLKAVCEMATDIPLKESFNTGKRRMIMQSDLKTAVKNTRSVLKQWFGKALEQVKRRKLEEDFSELVKEARREEKIGCY